MLFEKLLTKPTKIFFVILSDVSIRISYQLAYHNPGFYKPWHRHFLNPSGLGKAAPLMSWLSYTLETNYQCLPHNHQEGALSKTLLVKPAYLLGCSTLVQRVLAHRVHGAVRT